MYEIVPTSNENLSELNMRIEGADSKDQETNKSSSGSLQADKSALDAQFDADILHSTSANVSEVSLSSTRSIKQGISGPKVTIQAAIGISNSVLTTFVSSEESQVDDQFSIVTGPTVTDKGSKMWLDNEHHDGIYVDCHVPQSQALLKGHVCLETKAIADKEPTGATTIANKNESCKGPNVQEGRNLHTGEPDAVNEPSDPFRQLFEPQVAAPTKLTPEMLPLIDFTQGDIDTIVERVEGGLSNIQDIYALSPLQDGILFHHIMATKGDPYLVGQGMAFESRDILDRYLVAVQKVVARHDVFRTSIFWENLSTPAQVVLRQAPMSITELSLNPADGPISDQLRSLFDPREYHIDLTKAPLIRYIIAQDFNGHWVAVQLMHHIIDDQFTLDNFKIEVQAILEGQESTLPEPQPFRNLIAQVRSGPGATSHETYFTKMLSEIDTPALPYGISDVNSDENKVTEKHLKLPQDLTNSLRSHAKRLGVSVARLCHLAWAQVIARTSGEQRVVFGTVISGRVRAGLGSEHTMGPFINTLPIRVDVDDTTIEESVRKIQTDLAGLLEHEHASLALAQRCSGVPAGIPLFNTLLNYRRNTQSVDSSSAFGIKYLEVQERTNYPITMSVEDGGATLRLISQVVQPYDSSRICGYMQHALQ
ncbi:hypothetical protein BGZ79_004689, partial [Entomortierella chlamydospora]